MFVLIGKDIRQMMEKFDVNISIPPSMQSSNIVKVSGVESNVVDAIAALEERVKVLEGERADRVCCCLLIFPRSLHGSLQPHFGSCSRVLTWKFQTHHVP